MPDNTDALLSRLDACAAEALAGSRLAFEDLGDEGEAIRVLVAIARAAEKIRDRLKSGNMDMGKGPVDFHLSISPTRGIGKDARDEDCRELGTALMALDALAARGTA